MNYWEKPYCHIPFVEYYNPNGFSPKFLVRNTLTDERVGYDGYYDFTVINGGWLQLTNDQIQIPNFLPVEECEELNNNLVDVNYTFNCLGVENLEVFLDTPELQQEILEATVTNNKEPTSRTYVACIRKILNFSARFFGP